MADYVTDATFQEFLKEETEHHQRAEDAGNKRGEQIAEVNRKLDSLYKWRDQVEKKHERYDHFLWGNGSPGIDEVLRNVSTWIDEQKEAKKNNWSDAKKFAIGLVAFVLNSLVTIALARMFGG